jgi:hypothetical protein
MADRWVKRWKVESHSTTGKFYTVALDRNGEYGCSCPVWKFRRKQCKHIREVKAGNYEPETMIEFKEPEFVLANVPQVTLDPENQERCLVPLIPIGDTHFQATVVHDLLCMGFSWKTCRNRYHIAKRNRKGDIIYTIQQQGRRIYAHWVQGSGYTGYKTVRCEPPYMYGMQDE